MVTKSPQGVFAMTVGLGKALSSLEEAFSARCC